MPAYSDRQRRYIYAKASEGVSWAKRYVAEQGGRIKVRKRRRRARSK